MNHDLNNHINLNTSLFDEDVQSFLNFLDDGFISVSSGLEIRFVNQKLRDLSKLPVEQLIGKQLLEVFPQLKGSESYHAITHSLNTGQAVSSNGYFLPFNLWYKVFVCPSKHGLNIFIKDINAQKLAEESLKKIESRAQYLIHHSEDIIALTGANCEIISINPAFEKITGYTSQELVGKNRMSILHPDEIESSERLFKLLLENPKTPVHRTVRFISKSKKIIWLEGTITNLLHEPSVAAFVSNFHDITALKNTESSLIANEKLYHNLFENLLYGFVYCKVIKDLNDNIIDFEYVSANKAYENLTNFHDVVGRRISSYRADFFENKPEFMSDIEVLMRTGKTITKEYYVSRLKKWLALTYYNTEPDFFGCLIDDISEHKKLNEQQKLLSSIVDFSKDAIISKDLEGNINSWNKSAEKLLGYSKAEALGLKISHLIPPDRLNEENHIISEIKSGHVIENYETQRLTKSGEIKNVLVSISPIYDAANTIIGASNIYTDLTEKIASKKQEALFASIVNTSQDAIISRDADGYITSWNLAAEKLFGYTVEEAIDMHVKDFIPKDLRHELDKNNTIVLSGKRVTYFETERIRKNGERFYCSIGISPVHDVLGGFEGASIIARDITEKKISENKLHESQNNLKTIFENSTEAFLLLDDHFIVKAFNTKMRESIITQFGKEKLEEGHDIFEYVRFDRKKVLRENLNAVLKDESISVESDAYSEPGQPLWLKFTFTPVKELNKITGICIGVKNITESKLKELKIKESEENLKAIFNNTIQGFILLDTSFNIKLFNDKANLFVKLANKPKLLLSSSFLDYVELKDQDLFTHLLNGILKGDNQSFSKSYINKKGTITWLDIMVSPVYSNDVINGICLTIIDSTEKRLRDQEKEFDQQNLESLINNTHDMMWSMDKNFNLITFNKPFANHVKQITEVDIHKGINFKKNVKILPVLNVFEEHLLRAFKGESFSVVESAKFNNQLWAELSFYPTIQGNEVISAACFVRNITELKKREQEKEVFIKELSQSNADLKQFAYITSHNLRGPIANLLGLTGLLEHYPVKNDTLNQILDGIKKAAVRFDVTLKDLTTILTIKDNNTLTSEELLFETSLLKTREHFENAIAESGIVITYDFKTCNKVRFNVSYLDSIFHNLISNAIKYRDFFRPLRIEISTHLMDDFIVLNFSDNGIGFDVELNKNKVFKLYQRFHDQREGKGMGLFLIRSQLESLGGRIEVKSEINKGTTFTIYFKK